MVQCISNITERYSYTFWTDKWFSKCICDAVLVNPLFAVAFYPISLIKPHLLKPTYGTGIQISCVFYGSLSFTLSCFLICQLYRGFLCRHLLYASILLSGCHLFCLFPLPPSVCLSFSHKYLEIWFPVFSGLPGFVL